MNIESPPARFKNPPMKIAFTPANNAIVTKKGAPMLPKFDIAYETPRPVERIEVGKV